MKAKTYFKTSILAFAMLMIIPFIIDAQIKLQGLAVNNEGYAIWTADGTGSEAENPGHQFNYKAHTYYMAHYIASRDYNGIDPSAQAALCRFTGEAEGFPKLKTRLEQLGYTMDQLKIKSGISTVGRAVKGNDWGLFGNLHWSMYYGNKLTIEFAGQPILESTIDTNFCFTELDKQGGNWESQTSYTYLSNISKYATHDAQLVAKSFLEDLAGRPVKLKTAGSIADGNFNTNGRDGVFHEITSGTLTIGDNTNTVSKITNASLKSSGQPEDFYNAEFKKQALTAPDIKLMPNPCRNYLKIAIQLSEAAYVKVEIYNALGNQVASVANNQMEVGKQQFNWNAAGFAEGIYFCRIQAGDATVTRKIIKAN